MSIGRHVLLVSVIAIFFSAFVIFKFMTYEWYFNLKQLSRNDCIRFIPVKNTEKRSNVWFIDEHISSSLLPSTPNIVGLILARGGSKGIKKKNLAKFGNSTLLGRSLQILQSFGRFSSIWVSTDAQDIASEAQAFGVQVHWRSKESATDTAPSILGVQDFLVKHPDIDVIGLVQCTSPFVTSTFLSDAYNLILHGRYDSVFSVTRKYELRWKLNENGSVAPINFNPYKRPRRQDMSGELVENGMFYFAKVHLIHHGFLQGGKCGFVEVPANHSIDVDTPYDLKLARQLLRMV